MPAAYYTYLISSLPGLVFGAEPPISFEEFLENCHPLIPQKDFEILRGASLEAVDIYRGMQPTLKEWREFDTTLRNELVKIRAGRKKIDPLKYLRRDGYAEPHISHTTLNAYRNPSLLEAERALDLERWRVLEELSAGHYFDIDFLIAYAHKLLILERWQKINSADKVQQLEALLK